MSYAPQNPRSETLNRTKGKREDGEDDAGYQLQDRHHQALLLRDSGKVGCGRRGGGRLKGSSRCRFGCL